MGLACHPYTSAVLWAVALAEIAAIALNQFPEIPPFPKSVLVPADANLQFSPAATAGMLLVVGGTLLRIQCYRTLQKFFTFEVSVHKDHKLVTSGPYSIVRHPSYLGMVIVYVGMVFWYAFSGSYLRESPIMATTVGQVVVGGLSLGFLGILFGLLRRMGEEDVVMREVFGTTWEKWAQQPIRTSSSRRRLLAYQMTPEHTQEEESVEMLAGMMGVDSDQARRVLRKHKGNVEKAADAMLSGDNGDDEPPPLWPPSTESSQDPGYIDPSQLTSQSSSSTVIDLTGDESDSIRTLNLSQAQNDTKFGPTERAPNPSWQMVTSNTPVDTSQDDRAMNEAIEASLAGFSSSEELEILAMEDSVRDGGRLIHKIIHALSQVPQVRHNIATLFEPVNGPLWCMQLVELFANLDLAQLSAIVDKEVLPCMGPPACDGSTTSLVATSTANAQKTSRREESFALPTNTAETIVSALSFRLFQFSHARAESRGRSTKLLQDYTQQGSVVELRTGDPSSATPNDLISRLSGILSTYNHVTRSTSHDVIVEPSELVMFSLRPLEGGQGKSTAEPFVFPKQFYLDRFIFDNLGVAEEKKAQERKFREQIEELLKKKQFFSRNEQGRDILVDLRTTLHYFEEVAHNSEPEREESIDRTAAKLRALLDSIVSTVQEIDAQVEELKAEAACVYDIPELQNHLYDLRAVLMHTGLPGRKQIYSYIQDGHGVWWKTVDHTVTEVPEETALTDPTGLHLGAGPYLVLYSRHLSDEDMTVPVAWPQSIVDSIEDSNQKFLAMLASGCATNSGLPLSAAASTAVMSSMTSNYKFGERGMTVSLEDMQMQIELD
ncbi:hypothetical protein DXG01_008924 [Tephrocybe rancida]|nr:hypothetical protein DXG01_008924 [Tephrocybe rancida]